MSKFVNLPLVTHLQNNTDVVSVSFVFKVDEIYCWGPKENLSVVYLSSRSFVIDLPFTALNDILRTAMYCKDDDE